MRNTSRPGVTTRHNWDVSIAGARIELVGTDQYVTVGHGQWVLVGAGEDCDLVVDEETVSRVHLEVTAAEEGVRICDTSLNGSFTRDARFDVIHVSGEIEIRLGVKARIRVIASRPQVVADLRHSRFGKLVGLDRSMIRLFETLRTIARTEVPVIITGETGTGKELAARSIHDEGPRRNGPFEAVNCGALAENLLESTLFGHERGAYTGATKSHKGLFEMAHGGTLFLDEIAEASMAMQVKILRVLQEKEVLPLGATGRRKVDVRIIAATHADLSLAVGEDRFREDLYHRLRVARVELPPLRKRRKDVSLLAHDILRDLGHPDVFFHPETIEWFESRNWAGNVRALRNFLDYAVSAHPPGPGGTLVLPQEMPDEEPIRATKPLKEAVEEFKRLYWVEAKAICGGEVARMAALSGYTPWAVRHNLKRLDLLVPDGNNDSDTDPGDDNDPEDGS